MDILKLQGVKKSFGKNKVLTDVNLSLEQGTIMGLLGKNGAGKSTLLNLAVGLLKADQGNVEIMGANAWDLDNKVKHRVGFVAQTLDCFDWMTAQELIDYTSSFYKNWDKIRIETLCKNWEIGGKQAIDKMSEGEKQRLSIVLAMGHAPELLILDEPVASLDPAMRRDFIKELIGANLDTGTSILFSTHITSDIERVAAQVALLGGGKIQYQGELDALKESVVKLTIQSIAPLPSQLQHPSILRSSVYANQASLTVNACTPDLIAYFEQSYNASVQVQQLNLEEIFLELHA